MDKLDNLKQLKKGAEATIILSKWYEKTVIIKSRKIKKYRHPQLDQKIRKFRTIHEPQLLNEAKKAGVPTPTIFLVDTRKMQIIMEFIRGKQIKHVLAKVSATQRQDLCFEIGVIIAKLHSHGIIHGDLTTSNMILNEYGKIFLVDFGLAEKQNELESKGVDLHLMKRGLQSTHNQIAKDCFKNVMVGYTEVMGQAATKEVLKKIREIERRGRYVEERKIH